jgi:hypothetical protein
MLGSSRVAAQLAASQEWLSSMSERLINLRNKRGKKYKLSKKCLTTIQFTFFITPFTSVPPNNILP